MAWGKAGSTTLGSAGDDLDITSMTANDFNQFLIHSIASGNIKHNFRFDDNSGSVYARGRSHNSAGKSNDSSQAQIEYHGDGALDRFEVIYGVNLTGEEKLQIHSDITQGGSGAGTAPARALAVSKAVITCQYTRVDVFNDASGDYDTGSNITVLGSDLTTAAAVSGVGENLQAGSRFEETDTRKMYNNKEQPTPESTATYQVTDTSGTQNLYTGSYYISAQRVKSTSVLVGKRVSKLQMNIYKSNSPTGTATAGVWNSSGELQYTFGTIDVSTLETSTTEYTFNNTDSTHVFSADEYFGIKYQAGSSSNKIVVSHDDASPPFDGTDSVWSRYNGSWGDFDSVDNTFKLYLSTEGGTFAWQEIGA